MDSYLRRKGESSNKQWFKTPSSSVACVFTISLRDLLNSNFALKISTFLIFCSLIYPLSELVSLLVLKTAKASFSRDEVNEVLINMAINASVFVLT